MVYPVNDALYPYLIACVPLFKAMVDREIGSTLTDKKTALQPVLMTKIAEYNKAKPKSQYAKALETQITELNNQRQSYIDAMSVLEELKYTPW